MGCMACNNGCESRNTCPNICNCEICQIDCNTAQLVCSVGSQIAKDNITTFSGNFGCTLSKDVTINITAKNWNDLINFLKQSYNITGRPKTVPDLASSISTVKSGDIITAKAYNEVATAFGGLYSENTSPALVNGGKDGTIISADIFKALINKWNIFKLNKSQCLTCNDKCQGCNKCQRCNKCESCNSCQAHNPKQCTVPPSGKK